jgi:predicted RNase H-like HicB family nuclease
MGSQANYRIASTLLASEQIGAGNDRRPPERDLEARDGSEHPEAGRAQMRGAVVKGYVAILEGDEQSGYSAYSPDLPGVVAAGATREDTEVLMREAMAEHIALLRETGQAVPEPSADSEVTILNIPAA